MKLTKTLTSDIIEIDVGKWIKRNIFRIKNVNTIPYSSVRYHLTFTSFSEYWVELGKRSAMVDILHRPKNNVRGYSTPEILEKLSVVEFGPTGIGVIIFDIDPESIGRLYERVQMSRMSVFHEDMVFIRTETRDAARKILSKLPTSLASAVGIFEGSIFETNNVDIFS